MNTENNRPSEPHRFKLDSADKFDFKTPNRILL